MLAIHAWRVLFSQAERGAPYLSQSSFWSVTSEMAGTSAGSVNMGGQLGAAIAAYVTPIIAKHFGGRTSFFTAAMLCGLGALLWLAVDIGAQRGCMGFSCSHRPK